jgi:CPA1 family monovalent cation:H+ antiporter
MELTHQVSTVILLLLAVVTLATVAQRVLIPYPILLVLGGLALSLVPGLPQVRLDPGLVFLVFLPPVLWAAAYFTSLRDFRANLRPITLLAVGLVLATSGVVAVVARWIMPGIGWPAAIALGAIVSPPDAVAATAIARRLHIPNRVVVILEGESLINDATALILYRAAVTAAVTGAFSVNEAFVQFVLASVGGVAVGVAVSFAMRWAFRVTRDSFTETVVTLLAPYAAWIVAERLHVSGVLACVAGGLYLRRYFSQAVGPATRMQALAFWEVLVFLLNGFIFILIGLQLSGLVGAVRGAIGPLAWRAGVVSATIIAVRLVWVPIATILPRLLSPALRMRDPMPGWKPVFLIAWTGMRGIVSLASALALPLTTAAGSSFPFREDIILVTFGVILSTLVLQGLTLPPLVKRLRLGDDETLEREELHARDRAAEAALERLDELAGASWAVDRHVDQLRTHYRQRRQRSSSLDAHDGSAQQAAAYRRLRSEAIGAERRAVIGLRDEGAISDEILHRIEQELDVEAMRIGAGERRQVT